MSDLEIHEYVGQAMEPGLYSGVPHEVYHSDPCVHPSLSASIASRLVTQSPMHAWTYHPRLGGLRDEDTAAAAAGSLIDNLILGGGPEIVPIIANDYKTNAAREARDRALAEGKMPVIESKLVAERAHAEKIKQHLRERKGFEFDGLSQIVAVWKEGNAWCRARLDHLKLSTATIYDLKFVRSAAPEAIERHMVIYGTDVQRAAYVSAVEKTYPELQGRVKFQPIFVENGEVLAITMRPIGGTMKELGERKWGRGVDIWTKCLAANYWPDYGDDGLIEAPAWALTRDMETQIAAMGEIITPPF